VLCDGARRFRRAFSEQVRFVASTPTYVLCSAFLSFSSAMAASLEEALIQSYRNNPQLNAQRAATRATDENVSIALGGYRPRVTGTSSLSEVYLDNVTRTPGTPPGFATSHGQNAVTSVGATATQTLFNGFQTGNRTRQAEAQVFAARETLRSTEQTVLLSAATAYMNLSRDAALLELQRSNVNVLETTLRQTRDRFSAGEVTRTDVAQAESRLAAGRSQLLAAESNYVTSKAQYRQVVGVEPRRGWQPRPRSTGSRRAILQARLPERAASIRRTRQPPTTSMRRCFRSKLGRERSIRR
jgi:outer membrane protein